MLQQKQVNTDAEVSLFPKERYRVRKGFTGNVIFKVRPVDVQDNIRCSDIDGSRALVRGSVRA